MFKEVTIGDKEIEMLANGATPFWFRQVFSEDFFTEVQTTDDGKTVELFTKVGFIMAKQAKGADMKKVNVGQFMKWLEDFAPMDFPDAVPAIVDLYMSQTKETSKPKK